MSATRPAERADGGQASEVTASQPESKPVVTTFNTAGFAGTAGHSNAGGSSRADGSTPQSGGGGMWLPVAGNRIELPSAGASGAATAPSCSGLCNGLSCPADFHCASGSCFVRCQEPGGYSSGCDSKPDCQAGLQCKAGKCMRSPGSSCEQGSECAIGTCIERKCPELQARGAACESDEVCEPPTLCVMGTCRSPIGAPCIKSSECAEGICDPGLTCAKPLPLGQQCADDSQCLSGSCAWTNVCGTPQGSGSNCNSQADCHQGLICYQHSEDFGGGYCADPAGVP